MKLNYLALTSLAVCLAAPSVSAQPIRAPYYSAYRSNGYSTKNVTVRKKGENPFEFRNDHKGVNMDAWEANRVANPSQRAPINQPEARTPQTQSAPAPEGRALDPDYDPMHRSGK